MNKTIDINLDFDGTCVTHDYPRVGSDIGAVPVLKKLTDRGHRLILFTMRSNGNNFERLDGTIDNNGLTEAINWFRENDIPLYGIQTNPTQRTWTSSPKSYAPLMIDDSALGCPLKFVPSISNRHFVDWVRVDEMLEQMGLFNPQI
jgi:hypothetical protein